MATAVKKRLYAYSLSSAQKWEAYNTYVKTEKKENAAVYRVKCERGLMSN